jgi:flagellar hook-associated protein 1 FlgK
MGINSAIGNALTGLRVTTRHAELVSRNVANAMTEGYTAKSLSVSHQVHGLEPGGVRADGVVRANNPFMTAARRREDAVAQNMSTESDALRRISDLVLDPKGGDSLQSRYLGFENSLRALADTPESKSLQREAALAGRAIAKKLNTLSTEATRMRVDADAEIQRQVNTVKAAMKRVADLTKDIQRAEAAGRDSSALQDERDRQIDIVNSIIPIKQTRDVEGLSGKSTVIAGGFYVAAQGGALLMNGSEPYDLGFEQSAPGSVDGQAVLNGLQYLGQESATLRDLGLDGGSLEAAFKVRDEIATGFSAQLDALARDLAERFQGDSGFMSGYMTDDGVNPLLGVFVDYDPTGPAEHRFGEIVDAATDEVGFAGRIRLNADIWDNPALLKTGGDLGATNSLITSDGADDTPTFPSALYETMRATGGAIAVLGLVGERPPVDLVTEWASLLETSAGSAENEASFRLGAAEALRDEEVAKMGVDTDEEMRQLLLIEKAYAANAQVLQVADQMIAELLSIR